METRKTSSLRLGLNSPSEVVALYPFIRRLINAFIGFGRSKPKRNEPVFLVIGIETAGLFETVESLVDLEDVVSSGKLRLFEAFGLFDVNFPVIVELRKAVSTPKRLISWRRPPASARTRRTEVAFATGAKVSS